MAVLNKCQDAVNDHIILKEEAERYLPSPTLINSPLVSPPLKMNNRPSHSDTATQYSPPPSATAAQSLALERFSPTLVSPVLSTLSYPALSTTSATIPSPLSQFSIQDLDTKATQTENLNNALTSVSTQTDHKYHSSA